MTNVFILPDERRIDKYPSLFFIRKGALRYKTFNERLNGL